MHTLGNIRRHIYWSPGVDACATRVINSLTSGQSHLTQVRVSTHTDGQIVFDVFANVPPCSTCFLGPTRVHNPNGIAIGSATLHSSRQSVVGHDSACPPPLKIASSDRRSGPPSSNTWFLWSTRLRIPNGISIGLADHGRESLYFTMGRYFSLWKWTVSLGDLDPQYMVR